MFSLCFWKAVYFPSILSTFVEDSTTKMSTVIFYNVSSFEEFLIAVSQKYISQSEQCTKGFDPCLHYLYVSTLYTQRVMIAKKIPNPCYTADKDINPTTFLIMYLSVPCQNLYLRWRRCYRIHFSQNLSQTENYMHGSEIVSKKYTVCLLPHPARHKGSAIHHVTIIVPLLCIANNGKFLEQSTHHFVFCSCL